MGTTHFSGPVYSANGFYGPTYTYATLPSASSVNAGTAFWTTDGGSYTSDGTKWISTQDYIIANTRTSLTTTAPLYQQNFYDATTPTTKSYFGLTDAQTFLNISGIAAHGIEIGWNSGITMTDGWCVIAQRTLSNWDMSNSDRFLFEFGFPDNPAGTRINIRLIDNSGNIMNYTLINGTEKPEMFAQVILKSNFSLLSGLTFNWANLVRCDVRFTAPTTTIGDQSRRMVLYRMTAGAYTKPTVVISCDDIYSGNGIAGSPNQYGLNAMLQTCINRKVRGTHFVTDTEILNGGQGVSNKMTQAQVQAWCNAGWKICCHNIQHRPYAIECASYSKVGSVVTLVINWGSTTNTKGTPTAFTLNVGDYITVSRAYWNNINGTYPVLTVSQGASQTTVTYDVGNTTAIQTRATADGTVVSVDKYSIKDDNQLLRTMIKQQGYITNDAIIAYTYGANDEKARLALTQNGVRIARTTGGDGTNPEYSVGLTLGTTQIGRKEGLVVWTKNTTTTTVPSVNTRMMSVPTIQFGTFANAQTSIQNFLPYGGLLSIYWHGEVLSDPGITDQGQIDLINYLADLRDAGTINLITLDELDAMVSQRLNPNDIQN